ncbi:MAG TPA: MarR family winged helix-turn-helix transcriptional regulator [Gaiellaceae bacterium]|nr:MarR family winged helix-turn-helix transcriptional regulator [Gaiellaceae bacterium]
MQEISGATLVDELEALFTLLARTGSGLADETALTATQRLVLIELVASGPLRLRALSERIGAADPTVSRAVGGLVGQGLVERQADPSDRRAVLHLVTPKGRRRVERRRAEVASALDEALERLTPGNRANLLEAISGLNVELRVPGSEGSTRYPTVLASR